MLEEFEFYLEERIEKSLQSMEDTLWEMRKPLEQEEE